MFGVATPGERVLDIRIAKQNFGPASRRQLFRRWLLRRSAELLLIAEIFIAGEFDWLHITPPYQAFGILHVVIVVLAIAVFIAFLFCGFGRATGGLSRLAGQAVIQAIDAKLSKDSAFGVIAGRNAHEQYVGKNSPRR